MVVHLPVYVYFVLLRTFFAFKSEFLLLFLRYFFLFEHTNWQRHHIRVNRCTQKHHTRADPVKITETVLEIKYADQERHELSYSDNQSTAGLEKNCHRNGRK